MASHGMGLHRPPYIMGIVRGLSMIWSGGGAVCVEGNSGKAQRPQLSVFSDPCNFIALDFALLQVICTHVICTYVHKLV